MFRVLISLCLIAGAFAQKLVGGPCQALPSEYVDASRMTGMWYEYQHSDSVLIEWDRCARMIWHPPVKNVSKILFSNISTRDNINSTTVANCRLDNSTILLHIQLPVLGALDRKDHVLTTDYDNYAIFIGCDESRNKRFDLVWVVTRSLVPPKNIDMLVKNAFQKRGLQVPRLRRFNNKHCCRNFKSHRYSNATRHAT